MAKEQYTTADVVKNMTLIQKECLEEIEATREHTILTNKVDIIIGMHVGLIIVECDMKINKMYTRIPQKCMSLPITTRNNIAFSI